MLGLGLICHPLWQTIASLCCHRCLCCFFVIALAWLATSKAELVADLAEVVQDQSRPRTSRCLFLARHEAKRQQWQQRKHFATGIIRYKQADSGTKMAEPPQLHDLYPLQWCEAIGRDNKTQSLSWVSAWDTKSLFSSILYFAMHICSNSKCLVT